jgi:hypothetical protein
MRFLTLFTVTLAIVVGISFSAQSATLTMSADKATYNTSETITITVIGTTQKYVYPSILPDKDTAVQGFIYDLNGNATDNLLSHTQTALQKPGAYGNPGPDWDLTPINTQDNMSFGQLGGTAPVPTIPNLTAVMTFHANSSGTANFQFVTSGAENLDFFGITNAAGVSVTIIPEPTTAGLMGLGLIGLVISGRRRKS